MSTAHPGLTFNLSLVRTEPTYNQPVQQWTFSSDFAVSAEADRIKQMTKSFTSAYLNILLFYFVKFTLIVLIAFTYI